MRTVPAGGVVPTSWPPDFQQGMMLSSNRLRVPALTPGPARHSGANTETSAPNQVAQIYNFPVGTTGAGQTIAVIELGGGFTRSDLDAYFGSLGTTTPSISEASVDGASNNPGDTGGASGEGNLDNPGLGAVAPAAAPGVLVAADHGGPGRLGAS